MAMIRIYNAVAFLMLCSLAEGGGNTGKGKGASSTLVPCGELVTSDAALPTVEFEGQTCTVPGGILPVSGCYGDCGGSDSGSVFLPEEPYLYGSLVSVNSSCCVGSCFNLAEIDIACDATETYRYFLATACQCLGENAGPNILKVIEWDDYLEVYFDGVRQIPLNGLHTELYYGYVSHYFLDQCNLPTELTLYTVDSYDNINAFAAVDDMGLITDSTWQCYHDSDPPTAATELATTIIEGYSTLWISVSWTSEPYLHSTTCTKVL